MIEIDGRSGGGQMLRTALTLSAVTGKDFKIENIRGSRPDPGLKRQHLESVRAVERLCNADVKEASEGSQRLEFFPQKLENRSFTVNIGTAGSITLLMDTVLPLTSQFNSGFRLEAKGGTDVKWSPALDYLENVKLDILRKHGFKGALSRSSTGYYPKGGGSATLETDNYSMKPLKLGERGSLKQFEIYSRASSELEDQEVADRQASEAARRIKNMHPSIPLEKSIEYERTSSPGSSIVLKAVYENSVAGFDTLGEKGKRSEKVAEEAVKQFKSFHSTDAAVDKHMADQLMVFLAIVGGEFTAPDFTSHMETNLSVIQAFGRNIEVVDGRKVHLSL